MKQSKVDQSIIDEIRERYISVAEAAAEIGISGAFVRKLLNDTVLDGVNFGLEWRVAPASVEHYKIVENRRPRNRPKGSKNKKN